MNVVIDAVTWGGGCDVSCYCMCVVRVVEMLHVYVVLVLLCTTNYIHVNTVFDVKMEVIRTKRVWYV